MEINYRSIGKRIRAARIECGMTQERLAEMTDLSPSHISHIESGKTKLSLASLVQIANVLKTTPDSLLYDNISISMEAYDKDFKDLIEDCTIREKEIIFQSSIQVKKALKEK